MGLEDWASDISQEVSPHECTHEIIEDWQTLFTNYSWGNVFYANACFHLLFGQLPGVRNLRIMKTSSSYLDPRIHVCYLSPSGSGKGEGANFVQRIAERLQIRYQEIDEPTDAGLVGSAVLDGKGNIIEINYGLLHPEWGADIVSVTEASTIMTEKPKPQAQLVMNYFQKTMNTMGTSDATIVRKTGVDKKGITVRPTCSLFLTTYAPDYLTDIVVGRGLLQRMYLIARTVTLKDRWEASEIRERRQEAPPDTTEDEAKMVRKLAHIDRYYRNKTTIPVKKDALIPLKRHREAMFHRIDDVSPFLKDKLGEFITRFQDLQMKLALHFCCMRLGDEIEQGDVGAAISETDNVFLDLISFLERHLVVPKSYVEKFNATRRRVIMAHTSLSGHPKYARADGWVLRKDMVEELHLLNQISEQSCEEYLKHMISAKVLEERWHEKYGDLIRVTDRAPNISP